MNKRGISIYPDRSNFDDVKYLNLAAKYGFSRVFINFLTVKDEKNLK